MEYITPAFALITVSAIGAFLVLCNKLIDAETRAQEELESRAHAKKR